MIGQTKSIETKAVSAPREKVSRSPSSACQVQATIESGAIHAAGNLAIQRVFDVERKLPADGESKDRTSIDPDLASRIASLGGGQPLPGSVRSFTEPHFGEDFTDVRIHTDQVAARS